MRLFRAAAAPLAAEGPQNLPTQLFDQAPDGLFALSAGGEVLLCNASGAGMLGRQPAQVSGEALRTFVRRGDRVAFDDRIRAALSGEPQRFDVVVDRDREERTLGVSLSPVAGADSDRQWALIATARDVTSARKATNDLTRSESRYRNLFEAASDAIMTFDSFGRFTTVNGAAEKISGYTRTELIGKFFGPLLAIESVPKALLEFRRALSGAAGQFETTMMHKSGERRHLTVNYACPQLSREVICMIRDATAEKQLQAQLIQSEKMGAIGQLVSGVAHELNNPLASISAFAQLMLAGGRLDAEQRESVDVILGEAKRAARIVHNLLTFARQHKSEKVAADVNEIVNATLELRLYELNVRNIHVLSQLEEGSAPITMVDIHQLQQVLLNLITNAEQAMREAENGRHQLTIRTKTLEDKVVIEVEDTGGGIPATAMHQIFNPFFTTKPTGKGTGLGLSISLGIVSEHGGRIWAENVGNGCRFSVELPRVSATERMPLTLVPSAPVVRAESVRILVVDDEEALRNALERFLTSEGHSVVKVGSGSEAMWRAEGEEIFDIILLDLRMPDISGQEIFERWRADYRKLADAVVFITGDIVSADLQRFLSDSGRPFIAKPFDFSAITQLVAGRRAS